MICHLHRRGVKVDEIRKKIEKIQSELKDDEGRRSTRIKSAADNSELCDQVKELEHKVRELTANLKDKSVNYINETDGSSVVMSGRQMYLLHATYIQPTYIPHTHKIVGTQFCFTLSRPLLGRLT
jgi:hypothetical protein